MSCRRGGRPRSRRSRYPRRECGPPRRVWRFQTFTVPSPPAVARRSPSGLKATLLTSACVPEDDRIEPAEPLEVVPFPLPQALRALVEQFQGPAQVVRRQLPVGQGDAVEVEAGFPALPWRGRFRPPIRSRSARARMPATASSSVASGRHGPPASRVPPAPPPGPLRRPDRPRHDRLARQEPPQVLGQRRGRVVAPAPAPSAGTSGRSSRGPAAGRGTSRDGGTGSAVLTCSSVSRTVAPRNGGRPVSSS